MKAYYADNFVLPLPPGHRFPMSKYSGLRQRLISEGVLHPQDLHEAQAATDAQILRCHDQAYLNKVINGTLTDKEIRRIGFPWSPGMVERSRRSVGATIAAARTALREGTAANLAGGTHHAGRDHGAGYCVFNDVAIAARAMQDEGRVERVVIIDCDVHQGNGTADICADDPTIFTLSVHGQRNYPFRKIYGDIDIGLEDGTSDEDYLSILQIAVERALYLANADLAIYISGADPFVGDTLGRLALSKAGLAARDALVLRMCRAEGLPVVVTMGGGYAKNVDDIVDIHLQTIRIAAQYTHPT